MCRLLVLFAAMLWLANAAAHASIPVSDADSVAHGGGCRKDSLPGRCCHMDRKTGIPHCH